MPKPAWIEKVEQLIKDGYNLSDKQDGQGACNTWWKAWSAFKSKVAPSATSFDKADRMLQAQQKMVEWCQDFQMELATGCGNDIKYPQMGINFLSEVLEQFTDGDKKVILQFRKELARFHALAGDLPLAIGQMEKLIKTEPKTAAGYSGLAELLTDYSKRSGATPDYKRAILTLEDAKKKTLDAGDWGVVELQQWLVQEASGVDQAT